VPAIAPTNLDAARESVFSSIDWQTVALVFGFRSDYALASRSLSRVTSIEIDERATMSRQKLLRVLGITTIAAAISTADVWTQAPATAPPAGGQAPAPASAGQAPAAPVTGQRGRGFVQVQIGPPAPVPPEVAILRPSSEELTQINDALRSFIANDKSAAGPVLKKFEPQLLMQPPRLNVAATFTQTVQRMGPRHEGFVEIAKAGNIDLLLHGDSITDYWVQGDENKAMFEKYFSQWKTANFAIAGDTTQGVSWGLRNGEGQGFQPKAIMVMIGTNNGSVNTAAEIAEGIGAVVLEMRHDFPNAKILLLAVFPRSVPGDPVRDKIAEVNRIISRLDDRQRVFYLDIGAKFLDEKGVFLPNTFRPDNLHPVAMGYDIWGEAVQAKLTELMK
jgi:lysophospholipase L1-like esterase